MPLYLPKKTMTRASLGSSSMKPAMQISMQRHQTGADHDRPDAGRQPCVDTLRAEHDRTHTQRQPDEDQRQSQKTIAFPALVDKISILHIRKF